jgi:hypothetical protein
MELARGLSKVGSQGKASARTGTEIDWVQQPTPSHTSQESPSGRQILGPGLARKGGPHEKCVGQLQASSLSRWKEKCLRRTFSPGGEWGKSESSDATRRKGIGRRRRGLTRPTGVAVKRFWALAVGLTAISIRRLFLFPFREAGAIRQRKARDSQRRRWLIL